MQFLDLAGVQSLWDAIKQETAKSKTTVEGQTAHATNPYISVTGSEVTGSGADGHTNYVVTIQNAASPTDVTTAINALKGDATATGDTLGELEDRIEGLETGASVTITENQNPEGYAKSYTFTQNGNTIGTVNIPKDFLVKSGSVREIEAAEATQEMPEGTKVLDFVVNTIGGDGTDSHILIPVTDLVDVYTGGNGINVSNANVISAVLDTTGDDTGEGHFLTVGQNGIKLDGVTDAINAAKTELIGDSDDTATDDTIEGAKAYADDAVADALADLAISAAGDSYVSAAVDTNNNKKINVAATQSTITSLGLADTALQGVDTTQQGTNVKVTLGTNGKNVTLSVDETALTTALGGKADKVTSATNGNLAGLDANGNLTDSGYDPSDFATADQGTAASTALQSISKGTDGQYVTTTVGTKSNNNQTVAVSVTTANVSTSATTDGLAVASDVKTYVDGAVSDAVDELEAELRGDTTSQYYDATETLTSLRADIEAMGGDSGSISSQIDAAIAELDSDVNAATVTSNHVTSTNTNTATNAAATPVANVLTSITITDGILTAATAETIGAIPASSLQAIFNPSQQGS